MTMCRTSGSFDKKRVKLGIERDGHTGAFGSATVGECVIDAAQYVGLKGAQEFAFPILLGNRRGAEVNVHIVFTTTVVGTAPTGAASVDDSSSCVLSELASTRAGSSRAGSSLSGRSMSDVDDDGELPSPRTLLRRHDEAQRARSRERLQAARPVRATTRKYVGRVASVRIVARKVSGSGLAGQGDQRNRFRLVWWLDGLDGDGGARMSTTPASLIHGTVRWEHTETVTVAFVHPRGVPDALERRRVSVSLERVLPAGRSEEVGTCAFDLSKYAGLEGATLGQDYAFPLRLACGGGEVKVQLGFRSTSEGSEFECDKQGRPTKQRSAERPKADAPDREASSAELRVRLRALANGTMQQTVRSVPATMPLKLLARGLVGTEEALEGGGELWFRRGRDSWSLSECGTDTLRSLGLADGDVVSITVAAENRPPPRRNSSSSVQPKAASLDRAAVGRGRLSPESTPDRDSCADATAALKQQLADEEARRRAAEALSEDALKRCRSAEADASALKIAAAESRVRCEDAEARCGAMRERQASLERQAEAHAEELAKLSAELSAARSRAGKAEAELSDLQRELRAAFVTAEELRRRAQDAEASVTSLRRRAATAEAEAKLLRRAELHPPPPRAAAAPRQKLRRQDSSDESDGGAAAVQGRPVSAGPPQWIDPPLGRSRHKDPRQAPCRDDDDSSLTSSGSGGQAVWDDDASDTESESSPARSYPRTRHSHTAA
eukprot:TRINITY_DN888_c0_g2_i1.p1 TRINITY_DN888_c0_g2~~TRINITY_DN888_c0_g2_i1.p1  ORF type:complete len:726 (+),score=132.96 TRINITY_DN888_c0_g2_i1:303-2480(+)